MTDTFDDPNIVTRDYTCDPALIGMDAINATGRSKYVTNSVVEAMPRATFESGQSHFFRVGKTMKVRQPAIEAAKRGLRLVDPHTLAAFNAANPEFADTHPNATEWDGKNGNACCAAFGRWSDDERSVLVFQNDDDCRDGWWFAGFSE